MFMNFDPCFHKLHSVTLNPRREIFHSTNVITVHESTCTPHLRRRGRVGMRVPPLRAFPYQVSRMCLRRVKRAVKCTFTNHVVRLTYKKNEYKVEKPEKNNGKRQPVTCPVAVDLLDCKWIKKFKVIDDIF